MLDGVEALGTRVDDLDPLRRSVFSVKDKLFAQFQGKAVIAKLLLDLISGKHILDLSLVLGFKEVVYHGFETPEIVLVSSDVGRRLLILGHESVQRPVLLAVGVDVLVVLGVILDVVLQLDLVVVLQVHFDRLVVSVVGEPVQWRVLDTLGHEVPIGSRFHEQPHQEAATCLVGFILIGVLGQREPRSVPLELLHFFGLSFDDGVVSLVVEVGLVHLALHGLVRVLFVVKAIVLLLLLQNLLLEFFSLAVDAHLGSVSLLTEVEERSQAVSVLLVEDFFGNLEGSASRSVSDLLFEVDSLLD